MKPASKPSWTADSLLALGRSYQGAAILAAAADFNLFDAFANGTCSATQVARALRVNVRGVTTLLDALTALGLLSKSGGAYAPTSGVKELLTSQGQGSVLAMAQHQGTCLRRWAELARVVKTGRPASPKPGVRGEAGDRESFIGAMHNVSGPNADEIIRGVQPLEFKHLLDVGGASGTWTIAFLRACPAGCATLFDLPPVIPMARKRFAQAGLTRRVKFAPGDFLKDRFPGGADLVWVSAIIHQNSRAQNRVLFRKAFQALIPAGRIAIRDIIMDEDRTSPAAGALFAINMLVATPGGGTFTLREVREDLERAGFQHVSLSRRDEGMNSIVTAVKPRKGRD